MYAMILPRYSIGTRLQFDIIARTHGCVRYDSETHETVLLDCTTGEAGNAIQ